MRLLDAPHCRREAAQSAAGDVGAPLSPSRQRRPLRADPHLQFPPKPGDRPPDRFDPLQTRPGHGRGSRRSHHPPRQPFLPREAPVVKTLGRNLEAIRWVPSRKEGGKRRRDSRGDFVPCALFEADRSLSPVRQADPRGGTGAIREMLEARRKGEPTRIYHRAKSTFLACQLEIDRRVLIPRPETEILGRSHRQKKPTGGFSGIFAPVPAASGSPSKKRHPSLQVTLSDISSRCPGSRCPQRRAKSDASGTPARRSLDSLSRAQGRFHRLQPALHLALTSTPT